MSESKLTAFFFSENKPINVAESGDHVRIVFTDPPESSNNVEVKIIEAIEGKDTARREREIIVFRGTIRGKEFHVDNWADTYSRPKDAKRCPSIWIEAGGRSGDNPSINKEVILPDDKEESYYRFDLRLDIRGEVNGKMQFFKGAAELLVYYPVDVTIIPARNGTGDISLGVIRRWARQWKNFAPATRAIVEMALDPAPFTQPVKQEDYYDFLRAMGKAASIAHGGIIALNVGHGHGGLGQFPWTHLVPEDRAPHILADGSETFDVRLGVDQNDLVEGLEPAQDRGIGTSPQKPATLNALSYAGDIMTGMGPIPGPEELRLQTCNVGGSLDFLGMMADRVRIPVRGHRDFVTFHERNGRIYIHYEVPDDELDTTETDQNLHEWPVDKLSSAVSPDSPSPRRRRPRRF